jgi:RHS repeat-associated protein
MGRTVTHEYHPSGFLAKTTDWAGRTAFFNYDGMGRLRAFTTATVTGTPNGNDFPMGKTTVFEYLRVMQNGIARDLITKIWRPNEAGDVIYNGRPFAPFQTKTDIDFPVPSGPPTEQFTYQTSNPTAFDYLFVLSHTVGGTNASGVAAGGTSTYSYVDLIPDPNSPDPVNEPEIETTETDRAGNITVTRWTAQNRPVYQSEKTRGLRTAAGLPADPAEYVTTHKWDANGMRKEDVLPEGNKVVYVYDTTNANPRSRGNLLSIERQPGPRGGDQTFIKETFVYEPVFNQVARKVEARGNDPTFAPPLGSQSAARYTTTWLFDYQEGSATQALADKAGMTLQELTDSLAAAGIAMNLGDLNADGVTNQINGKVVKIIHPSVLLPSDSTLPEGGGGTQSIVEVFAYNQFGQMIYQIDPEGNVTDYVYYPENDPDGDGVTTPAPPDGRTLNSLTGGYLKEMIRDSREITGPGIPQRRNTPGVFVAARTIYKYNPVGWASQITDGRGTRTDYVVNALNQTVRRTAAAAVAQFTPVPSEPETLIAFPYLTDSFYDRNDNLVRRDVENRDGDPEPAGFITSSYVFDILDNMVEMRQEVNDSGGVLDAVAMTIDPGTPRQNDGFFLVTQYRYDANENQAETTFPAGNKFKNVYDERDLLMQSTRGFGAPEASTFGYVYDKNRNLTQFIDGEDNDGGGNDKVLTTYDGFDRVRTVTDQVGDVVSFTYDPASNTTREKHEGNLGGPSRTNNNTTGNVILADHFFLHDERNRVFRSDEALLQNQSTTRSVSLTEGPLVPGDGRVNTRMDFDRSSRQTMNRDDDLHTAFFFFDGANRRTQITDPAGNIREFAFDDVNNVIEIRETDVASNIGGVPSEVFLTTNFFDALNRLTKTVDNIGQTGRMGYDSRDNVKSTSDAQNVNSGGTIQRRIFSGASVAVNAPGNTTSHTYDGLSRRLTTVLDLRVGGDGSGAIDTSNPANPDGKVTLTSTWDGNSRLKSQADDKGNTTSYVYDAVNRRKTETFADSTTNQYVFDRDDNVTSMTDENGSVRTCSYDGANRLTQCSISRSVAFGVVGTTLQTWQYDGLHRLTRATDDNDPGLAADDSTVTLAYDSLSRVIEEVQSLNDGTAAKAVTSDWFADGQRTGLTYPNNRKLIYAFDQLERPIDIRNNGAGTALATYAYIGGRVLVRNYPANGTRLTYLDNAGGADIGYDAARRIVRHRNLKNSDNAILAEFEYGHNREDHRLFEKRLHDIDGLGRAKGERYVYDSLYRVTDFKEGRLDGSNLVIAGTETETQNWTLDGVSNWATTVQDGTTKNQTITTLNEYSSFGGVTNVFDENGNYQDDGSFTFKWDFLNRLREVRRKSDGALLATYVYDAFTAQNHMFGSGRRVRRETTASANVGAGIDKYFYDGRRCVEERRGNDTVQKQYVIGIRIDEWLVLDRDTTGDGLIDVSHFYHQNSLGSVVALTDLAGAVVERYTYGAYGKPLFENPDNTPAASQIQSVFGNPHLFAGYRFDPEAGLSYVRHRYLHHGQGRWLGRDPIGLGFNYGNPYLYVLGIPVNLLDSMGLVGGTWTSWGWTPPPSSGPPSPYAIDFADIALESRVGGLLQAAGGFAMMVAGAATAEVGVGVAIFAIGLDIAGAGATQAVTGQTTPTLLERGAVAAGEAVGVPPEYSRAAAHGVQMGAGAAAAVTPKKAPPPVFTPSGQAEPPANAPAAGSTAPQTGGSQVLKQPPEGLKPWCPPDYDQQMARLRELLNRERSILDELKNTDIPDAWRKFNEQQLRATIDEANKLIKDLGLGPK